MSGAELIVLILIFLVTSIIGVVTGSNSLITVPAMFQLGVDEKVAVATNMFGLTFMAIGGTIPFLRQGAISIRKLSPHIILTLAGSAIGAGLVGLIANSGIKLIVSFAMIAVIIFSLLHNEFRIPRRRHLQGPEREQDMNEEYPPKKIEIEGSRVSGSLAVIGYAASFFLAIYGGLYSGGYVTMLTALFVAVFGMGYSEAVGSTKLINVFSSLVATLVFMWQGLVNYSLGAVLALTMFAGAYIGAHFAVRFADDWLKRIFLATVFILAVKSLYDLL